MMNILYLLPKNSLSRCAGFIAHIRWPKPFSTWLIQTFAEFYKINISEAEKPLSEYVSVGDFFVRRLKEGVRPLGVARVLHPADSVVSQCGIITDGKLIQAKGKAYSVSGLLQSEKAKEAYQNGLFVTYYLCPTDYHRVHSPISGKITAVTHLPGNLWPVNEWSVNRIEELFCINERVLVEFETEWGMATLVFVGATNVGKISLSFEPQILSNQVGRKSPQKIIYNPPKPVKKGDELGAFHMGSTVVMVYSETFLNKVSVLPDQWIGRPVRVKADFY